MDANYTLLLAAQCLAFALAAGAEALAGYGHWRSWCWAATGVFWLVSAGLWVRSYFYRREAARLGEELRRLEERRWQRSSLTSR